MFKILTYPRRQEIISYFQIKIILNEALEIYSDLDVPIIVRKVKFSSL